MKLKAPQGKVGLVNSRLLNKTFVAARYEERATIQPSTTHEEEEEREPKSNAEQEMCNKRRSN